MSLEELVIIPMFAVSLIIGLAVARWWVVLTPVAVLILVAAGVAVAGGDNGDGTPNWQIAAFVVGYLALFAVGGLLVGVLLAPLLRERQARTRPR
jgi:hypothetical protein